MRAKGSLRPKGIATTDRHAWRDVATARKLFELQGVRATSIAAIAREVNDTCERVYHHFANRNGLIAAVIDDYVEDLVENMVAWNEARVFGDTPGSLRRCIQTFRYSLYDGAGRTRPMIAVLEDLGVRDAFDVRATRETADCLANHIAGGGSTRPTTGSRSSWCMRCSVSRYLAWWVS